MPGGRVGVALFFMISGYFQIYKSTVSVRKVVYETVFYSVLLQLVALILKIGSLGNIARGFSRFLRVAGGMCPVTLY